MSTLETSDPTAVHHADEVFPLSEWNRSESVDLMPSTLPTDASGIHPNPNTRPREKPDSSKATAVRSSTGFRVTNKTPLKPASLSRPTRDRILDAASIVRCETEELTSDSSVSDSTATAASAQSGCILRSKTRRCWNGANRLGRRLSKARRSASSCLLPSYPCWVCSSFAPWMCALAGRNWRPRFLWPEMG